MSRGRHRATVEPRTPHGAALDDAGVEKALQLLMDAGARRPDATLQICRGQFGVWSE